MNSRGVLQQLAAPVAPPKPRPRPRPASAPPHRSRPHPNRYRPPSPADIHATVPVTAIPEPAPRRRAPGVIDLDSLEPTDTELPPKPGWRDRISRLTRIDRAPSKQQAYERGLHERVATPVGSAVPIAVINLKGGVGKTAVVEALGSTLADAREDRVIAVDMDGGDLTERHGRGTSLSIADLLSDRSVARYEDVRAHTYRNSPGLEVLGHPDYAQSSWRLERDDVVKAFSLLRRHYSVVLVDGGRALKSNVLQAVLSELRALVVVTNCSVDAIAKTRTTLDWLVHNGHGDLLRSTVLAVNHTEQGKPSALASKELGQLTKHFAPERVVVLPFDPHLREGKEIILSRMSKESRQRYREMAAVLADTFPRREGANLAG